MKARYYWDTSPQIYSEIFFFFLAYRDFFCHNIYYFANLMSGAVWLEDAFPMSSVSCRSPPSVSGPSYWPLGRTGSTSWAIFHFLSPSDCSLSTLFKELEYTQDHLLVLWQIFSQLHWGQGPPGFQTPFPSRVTHFPHSWGVPAEVKSILHSTYQAVWGQGSYPGVWAQEKGRFVLLVSFLPSELFSLVANEKFIAFCWYN